LVGGRENKLQFFKTVSSKEYGALFFVQNMDLVKFLDLHVKHLVWLIFIKLQSYTVYYSA